MRWLINYIRSCFCKHEWELIFDKMIVDSSKPTGIEIPNDHIKVYRCKKCGYSKKYKAR